MPSSPPRSALRRPSPSSSSSTPTQTMTIAPSQPIVLRLRGYHTPETQQDSSSTSSSPPRRRIQWASDVVDNEHLGRKSSKVCCIYHKTRPVGESSSESESSDSDGGSDSDGSSSSGNDDGRARMGGRGKNKGHGRHGHSHGKGNGKADKGGKRKPSPNAYERMPRYDIKKLAPGEVVSK